MRVALFSGVAAATNPPVATFASFGITTDTFANTTQGGYIEIEMPGPLNTMGVLANTTPGSTRGRFRIYIDKLGTLTVNTSTFQGLYVVVSVVGLTTADQIRDAIIAALGSATGVTFASGGAGNVSGTNNLWHGVMRGDNTVTALGGAWAVTDWSGGSISGVPMNSGPSRGAMAPPGTFTIHVYSTNRTGTQSITVRLWRYSVDVQRWAPMGAGVDTTKGTINNGLPIGEQVAGQPLEHSEILTNLHTVPRIYAEVIAPANGTFAADLESVTL